MSHDNDKIRRYEFYCRSDREYLNGITFIEHRDRSILKLNFAGAKPAEILAAIENARATISSQPPQSLLVLTDVTDARYDEKVSQAMKEFTLHNNPFVKASAVVGVTGLRKILFETVLIFSKRKIASFDDTVHVMDWLADQGT